MNKNDMKRLIIDVLQNSMGDDLVRAKMAFNGLSESELNKEYGKSGNTCKQILYGYEQHEIDIRNTIIWVNTL